MVKVQRAEICFAKSRRICQHSLEHWTKFTGGACDDAEHFRSRRRLLLQRLAEISRALAQFVKQPRVPMAMTAWAAKFCSRAICFSVKAWTFWRITVNAPISSSSLSNGIARTVRYPAFTPGGHEWMVAGW